MTQYAGQFTQTEVGDVPLGLDAARAALLELAGDTDDVVDCINDDVPENYEALMAFVRECRTALDSIVDIAHQTIADTAKWHRQCLADIESLNLPEVSQ